MYFIDVAGEDIETGDLIYINNDGKIRKCHNEDEELIDEVLYKMYGVLIELG